MQSAISLRTLNSETYINGVQVLYLNFPAGVGAERFELHRGIHALCGVHEVAVQIRLHDGVQELELGVVAAPQDPFQQVAPL